MTTRGQSERVCRAEPWEMGTAEGATLDFSGPVSDPRCFGVARKLESYRENPILPQKMSNFQV